MSKIKSRRDILTATGAFALVLMLGGLPEAQAQSHSKGRRKGKSGGGGHTDGGHDDDDGGHDDGGHDDGGHDDGGHDDGRHDDGGHDDSDHASGKRGPKYMGGKEVSSSATHGHGRSLEERVLSVAPH